MPKHGKKFQKASEAIDGLKLYDVTEAVELVLKSSFAKFDETVDVAVNLGVNPKYSDQMVRGAVSMPHGLGKTVRVVAFCKGENEEKALSAGAIAAGGDELVEKIKGGWTDIDVIITMPPVMGKIGALGRILGPRGLMPNPKSGTVTMEVGKAIQEVKQGKIDFKVDKFGIVHTSIGKVSFSPDKLMDNAREFVNTIVKLKPVAAKGTYIRSIYLSSTMSPGIQVEPKSVTD